MDYINRGYGLHAVRPLAGGGDRRWEMRRGQLSGRNTTRLDEMMKVHAH